MTRRFFLDLIFKSGFFILFVSPLLTLRVFKDNRGNGALLSARRLSGIFKNRASAQAIGSRYLSAYPQEADLDRLVSSLSSSDLRLQNQKDFEEGRTVVVEGWILGLTEARLCGLAALT